MGDFMNSWAEHFTLPWTALKLHPGELMLPCCVKTFMPDYMTLPAQLNSVTKFDCFGAGGQKTTLVQNPSNCVTTWYAFKTWNITFSTKDKITGSTRTSSARSRSKTEQKLQIALRLQARRWHHDCGSNHFVRPGFMVWPWWPFKHCETATISSECRDGRNVRFCVSCYMQRDLLCFERSMRHWKTISVHQNTLKSSAYANKHRKLGRPQAFFYLFS